MIRKLLCAGVFALAAVGCEKAGSLAGSAGNAAKTAGADAAAKAGDALTKARDEIHKNFDIKAVEDKIATLSGDAKETATKKLADFKKLVEEFKAAPMEKLNEWKDKLTTSFKELKTSVGL